MAISYLSNMSIDGTLTLSVNADDATYTGIVTVDGGTLKYRTKAQIKSDIGAGSGDGTVTGSGTAKNLTMWSTGGTGIEDSPIKTVTTNTLNQIVVEDGERLIIDKPSSVTSGDPAFNISQDGTSKVEFGWDDDGGGFGFMYNYSGNGLKLGAAGNNPMIEVVTTSGSESVNLHKQLELKDYGSGTYTGTSAYYLIADSSGNVIEKTPAQVRSDIGAGTGSGSVTSVGLSIDTDDALAVAATSTPVTGSGTLELEWQGDASEVVLGSGELATLPTSDTGVPAILSNGTSPTLNTGITALEVRTLIGAGTGSGTVSSVGITETGDALTITNSPITGSGDINIAGAGASTQYINGELNLATFPTIPSVSDKTITITPGTGISGGGDFTLNQGSDETITITNDAPDQTVALTGGTGISISGTYPSFTITNDSPSSGGTVTSVGATTPINSSGGTAPTISIDNATAAAVGAASVTAGTGISVSVTNGVFEVTNSSPSSGGTIGGSGTANKVAKFTAGSTIGDGPITFSSNDSTFSGTVTATTVGSSTQDAANIFKGSVISSPSTSALGLILRNSSDNAIIGSLLRTSASTSELTTDTLSLPGTTSQYIRGDGSAATFPTIPSGGVSGSGTSGKVAKFTGSTSIGDGDITFGTNTITLGDPTSSSTATLFVDTANRRVGYRTINPTSAFEVVGTINTQGLNCNEQQFFVDKDNTYIKAGAYGGGEFFGMTGSANQPKYTYAAGSGGKFVEDERIETIKIQQNGFYNWFNNGCILIPAQGTNTYILVKEITVYKSAGTNPSMGTVYFGWCEQASPTANCQMFGTNHSFDFWAEISSNITQKSGTWLWQSQRPMSGQGNQNSDVSSRLNRPFIARVASGDNRTTGTFNGPWYIQIKYQNINYIAGLQNNVDRTITSTGSGQNSRTAFLSSSQQNFSSICPGAANIPPSIDQTYYYDNTSGCNGNNGYPATGDICYTTATGGTVLTAGYYYLYAGGGSRYYIQIGASGIVSGTSCSDSVKECDQPID